MSSTILDGKICYIFDKGGNIYFSPSNEPSNYYELNITSNNSLSCEKIIMPICYDDTKFNIGDLVQLDDTSLKIKTQEILEEDDDYNSDDDTQKKYMPENFEYNEYMQNDDNDDDEKVFFNFSEKMNLDNNFIHLDDVSNALYDTIVYRGDIANNELVMKTTMINDMPLYRLCLYTSGDIKFRPFGSENQFYKLKYDDIENNIKLVTF